MTTQDEVRDMARKVREAANDLRMLEVLGAWIDADDVSGDGDSGAGRYGEFAGASGDRVEHVQSQQGAQLGTEFDWIIPYFEYYARIPDTPYTQMNEALQTVITGFAGNAVSYQDDIQGRFDLGDWDGAFADKLHDNLISPLDDIPYNQAHIVRELQTAVLGHWNLVLATRKAMYNIGAVTKARLDAMIGLHKNDPNDAFMPVLGAVLAVVGIVAALPTAGASVSILGVSLAILGAAKATTEAGIAIHQELNETGVDKLPVSIQGGTSADIITAMLGEIGKLDEHIRTEENLLDGKLKTSLSTVEEWVNDTTGGDGRKARSWHIQGYRSELADGSPKPGEFGPVG